MAAEDWEKLGCFENLPLTKKEFYFLGEIYAEGDPKPIHMESTNDDAFEILYRLDIPVRNDIYDYIVRD